MQRGAAHFPWLDDPGAFVRTVAAFLDPDVHSVQAGGIRLAYRVWGDPSAPPVVLVHGRSGDSSTWTRIAEELAAEHRVYALDFRGHGLSDWTGRYSFELFRDDLHAFLEARNLSGATVIGHSLGGAAAYLLAERQPGLIGRLVIEEAPPPSRSTRPAATWNARKGSSASTGPWCPPPTPSSTNPIRPAVNAWARSPLPP
ncbi:alpha/beta fold hydrolase [Streptomyces sp. RKAG290]|uniref:alpha/beta fold hydrolase n=1 Tax=Streptomyces sp. RKAG290 TaxID=2888348 RepID=UPI0020333FCA|nr:alpha/beta fold hydrolase [Streptomyces sp. RKAG290]MCM2415886.1 alpha/beta fold hydrolase [Streptomyces sp. RKAG290]